MNEQEDQYKGISYRMEEKAVHIDNTEALIDFMRLEGNGSLELADHILVQYREQFGKELQITRHSLAIEIICHVYVGRVSEALDSLLEDISPDTHGPLSRALERTLERTDVIDCGESDVDGNRFVWDALVPLRGLIYAIADR